MFPPFVIDVSESDLDSSLGFTHQKVNPLVVDSDDVTDLKSPQKDDSSSDVVVLRFRFVRGRGQQGLVSRYDFVVAE